MLERLIDFLMIYPIIFLLMGIFFLIIGVKVVWSKKPVFTPARYFLVFMIVAFSPQLISTIGGLFMIGKMGVSGYRDIGLIALISPLMFVILFVFFWLLMKGYIVVGIAGESIQDAIHFALNKLNLPFEEKLAVINLTSIDASLHLAIQGWAGSGQIRLKNSKDPKMLSQIVSCMKEYYQTHDTKSNYLTAIFYLIFGVLMLVSAGAFYYYFP